jgi:type I restriction enzyme S subunit
MSSGVVDFIGAGKINSEARARIRKGVGAPRDVILSHKGTVGRVAVAPPDSPDFVCSPQTTFWRSLDESILSQRYLRYVMVSGDFTRQLDMLKGQTDMAPYVSLSDQRSMEIELPDMPTQRAIAEVLGVLDDKIATNERILVLLDELIRASYQLLPNSIHALRDIADQVRVQVDPDSVGPRTRYIGLEHLPRRRAWANQFGHAADVSSAKFAFSDGDVLFGKLRPYFHKVVSAGYNGICSTDIIVLRAKDPVLAGLVLAAASSDEAIRACTASSEGTRMPRTSWKDLAAVQIRDPEGASAEEFSESVILHSKYAQALIEESAALARTRDELLPLLMSGKLRVKDAEKKVEAIV